MKKKLLSIVLLLSVIFVFSGSETVKAAGLTGVSVTVNGEAVSKGGLKSKDTLFLSLQAVCDKLGYTVTTAGKNEKITLKSEENTIVIEPESNTITNGSHKYFEYIEYNGNGYIGAGCLIKDKNIYMESGILENCLNVYADYDKEDNSVSVDTMKQNDITFKNIKESSNTKYLTTNIQYPKVSYKDKVITDKINKTLKAVVTAAKKAGKKNAEEIKDYGGTNKCNVTINYKITYNQKGLLSVILYEEQYAGGAHGSLIQHSYTYDLKTGIDYQINDLMDSTSGYIKYMNSNIKKEIKNRGLSEVDFIPFKTIAKDQAYYLSNHGLRIYLQEDEYFPHAAGVQEFNFTYDSLSKYLKPEFSNLY